MGTYYYGGQVKFELPWDFEYSKECNDEGKETYHIRTGSYYNDDGEKCHKFSCGISTAEASDDTPVTSLRDMAKNIAEGDGKTRFLMFDENPEIVMFTRGMPMNLFGMSLLYYTLVVSVLVERNHIVNLSVVSTYMEDDEYENLSVFENMATVIRSMSVNGKKNDLQGMDAQALHTALKPCFNEEDNVDLDERLRELLGGSEEDVSYADQPLPDGVCASEDGYAVINDDWAVRLPDGWVFSTEEEYTGGRPLAAISREEYEESGRGPFDYGDNCFIVFRMAETGSNEYGMHGMLAGLMNSNEKTVIDRLGLRVSYSCRHEESSTYCQFVTVTTRRASYMIQLFYTDEYLGEYGRIGKIEEILNTICLAYEVPYSERYQRREHAKPAVTTKKTTKKSISFKRVCPDESLYPHYHSLLNSPLKSMGLLGVKVVVNSTGTEYAFQSFRSVLNSFSTDPDENLSEEQQNRLTRILNKDVASYELHKKAKAMQSLFHVDPSVFDPKHDRECELEHGLMHRAYMMSALRSFAWTLSAYCKESGETPATVDYSCIRDLIAYIASHNWLNYDGESHCDGLCGGSDLHVYFVPDSTSAEDRRQLRGDGISEEEEARIREKFQNFNIIRSQVRSLDALRRDLAYIYPAIEKIYDTLKASRNNKEQLLGDEADILYAWCALALAAKEPFFSEDGPMNYWYDQEETEEEAEANRIQQEKAAYDAWMAKYGEYLARDPQISFAGKLFVFSGLATHADPKDHPTIQKVLDRGGEFRSKVSGLTDYLVIDPISGGGSKLNTAIEQQKKGKPVQIILLKDLETVLEGIASKTAPILEKAPQQNATAKTTDKEPLRLVPGEYSVDANGVLTQYTGRQADIILPDCVTVVGEGAFWNNQNIKSVIIPQNVTSIEKDAFHGCKKLKSVSIPGSVNIIGKEAFSWCEELENVTIFDGVEVIGEEAFSWCKALESITIPGSIKSIGENAFSACKNLKHIIVTEGATRIGEYAFRDCEGLERISLPESVKDIDHGAFFFCKKLKNITIPDGVTSIGWGAFEECSALKSINIPSGVKVVDEEVFCGCTELESITLPQKLESIGRMAFCGCEKLGTIAIPDSVTTIEELAFSECYKLKRFIIPSAVTTIGNETFAKCKSLESIIIPKGIISIGKQAFTQCEKLKNVTIPNSVTTIDEDAFSGLGEMESIVIPDSMTSISNGTFFNCTKLKNITIPSSVTSIGRNTFLGCKELTIIAPEGSYALEYARKEGIPFEFLVTEEMRRAAEERRRREEEANLRALQAARKAAEEERKRKEEEERRKREYEERRRREAEERARKAAEEAEQRRKAAEEAERKRQAELVAKRTHYDELQKNISEQERIIAENRGWFGEQAKVRKAAKEQLAILQAQLAKEFPNGKP